MIREDECVCGEDSCKEIIRDCGSKCNVCDVAGTLDIFKEFNEVYKERLKKTDEAGGDVSQLKLKTLEDWVADLTEQNTVLVETVEALEKEALFRLELGINAQRCDELEVKGDGSYARYLKKDVDNRSKRKVSESGSFDQPHVTSSHAVPCNHEGGRVCRGTSHVERGIFPSEGNDLFAGQSRARSLDPQIKDKDRLISIHEDKSSRSSKGERGECSGCSSINKIILPQLTALKKQVDATLSDMHNRSNTNKMAVQKQSEVEELLSDVNRSLAFILECANVMTDQCCTDSYNFDMAVTELYRGKTCDSSSNGSSVLFDTKCGSSEPSRKPSSISSLRGEKCDEDSKQHRFENFSHNLDSSKSGGQLSCEKLLEELQYLREKSQDDQKAMMQLESEMKSLMATVNSRQFMMTEKDMSIDCLREQLLRLEECFVLGFSNMLSYDESRASSSKNDKLFSWKKNLLEQFKKANDLLNQVECHSVAYKKEREDLLNCQQIYELKIKNLKEQLCQSQKAKDKIHEKLCALELPQKGISKHNKQPTSGLRNVSFCDVEEYDNINMTKLARENDKLLSIIKCQESVLKERDDFICRLMKDGRSVKGLDKDKGSLKELDNMALHSTVEKIICEIKSLSRIMDEKEQSFLLLENELASLHQVLTYAEKELAESFHKMSGSLCNTLCLLRKDLCTVIRKTKEYVTACKENERSIMKVQSRITALVNELKCAQDSTVNNSQQAEEQSAIETRPSVTEPRMKIASLEKQIASLNVQVTELNNTVLKKDSYIKLLERPSPVSTLKTATSTYESSAINDSDYIEELKIVLCSLRMRLNEIVNEMMTPADAVVGFDEDAKVMVSLHHKEKIATFSDRICELIVSLDKGKQSVTNLPTATAAFVEDTNIDTQQETVNLLQNSLQMEQNEVANLSEQLEKLRAEKSEMERLHQGAIQELENKVFSLESQLKESQDSNEVTDKELSAWKGVVEDLRKEMCSLKKRNDELNSGKSILESKLNDQIADSKNTAMEISRLKTKVEKLLTEIDFLHDELEKAKAENDNAVPLKVMATTSRVVSFGGIITDVDDSIDEKKDVESEKKKIAQRDKLSNSSSTSVDSVTVLHEGAFLKEQSLQSSNGTNVPGMLSPLSSNCDDDCDCKTKISKLKDLLQKQTFENFSLHNKILELNSNLTETQMNADINKAPVTAENEPEQRQEHLDSNTGINEQVKMLETQLKLMACQLCKAEEKCTKLTLELDLALNEVDREKKISDVYCLRIEELRSVIAEKSLEVNRWENQYADVKNKLLESQATRAVLITEISEVKKKLCEENSSKNKFEGIRKKFLDTHNEIVSQLKAKEHEWMQRCQEGETEVMRLSEILCDLKEELECTKQALGCERSQHCVTHQRLSEALNCIATLKTELGKKDICLSKLQDALRTSGLKVVQQVNRIDQLECCTNQWQKETWDLRTMLTKALKERSECENALYKKTEEIKLLHIEMCKLQTEKDQLMKEKANERKRFEEELSKRIEGIHRLQNELKNMRLPQGEMVRGTEYSMVNHRKTAEEECQRRKEENAALRDELNKSLRMKFNLERELSTLHVLIDKLKCEILEKNATVKNAETKLANQEGALRLQMEENTLLSCKLSQVIRSCKPTKSVIIRGISKGRVTISHKKTPAAANPSSILNQ